MWVHLPCADLIHKWCWPCCMGYVWCMAGVHRVGGTADRVYAHLAGVVQADQLVRAHFTGELVLSWRAKVVHEYEVLVRYTARRCVKHGRAATKDDSGSDSEYEEEERTRWEDRSTTIFNQVGHSS